MSQSSSTDDELRLLRQNLEALVREIRVAVVKLDSSQHQSVALLQDFKALLQIQQENVALFAASQKENTASMKTLLSLQGPTVSQAVAQLARVDPRNIQEVAASQLAIVNSYYQGGLEQSQQSFRWSLIWGGIGFLFFLGAVGVILFQKPSEVAIISAISGALVEIFASTYLLLHKRAADQLSTFHSSLNSTQLILLANSMCESLEGEMGQKTRADIIRLIVDGALNKFSPVPQSKEKKTN